MTKPQLIFADTDDDTRLNSNSTMQDGVVTIPKLLHFRVPDGENPRHYSDLDVYSHPLFPQKYSALAQDPRYKFYGNASVRHDRDDSKYFTAELEYSTRSPNAKDSDGNEVTSETKPWKLRPDNITITYPEERVPFEAAYTNWGERYDSEGNAILPVQNTAGDPFIADQIVRNMELNFSFAAKSWDPNDGIRYGGTINSKDIVVCGVTIPKNKGLLRPPECEYITTYEENSNKIKWQYWNVRVSIYIVCQTNTLIKKVLNIGDRAFFIDLNYSDGDDLFKDTKHSVLLPGSFINASQICRFRKYKKYPLPGGKTSYVQTGDNVFCSWDQFIAFREAALAAASTLGDAEIAKNIDPQCEQVSQIPLDNAGYVDENAIKNRKYPTRSFRQYPSKSWSGLNLPKKGMKW